MSEQQEKKRSRLLVVGDAVRDMYNAHKTAISMKNMGRVVGSAASAVAVPCLKFYDGVREGFNKKSIPDSE